MVYTILSLWCQGCEQTDVLSGNQNTKSDDLFKTIEAHKKRNMTQSDKHTKRKSGKRQ